MTEEQKAIVLAKLAEGVLIGFIVENPEYPECQNLTIGAVWKERDKDPEFDHEYLEAQVECEKIRSKYRNGVNDFFACLNATHE